MGTSGRLSLSWVNKDRSLISTQDGGYEWLDRDDYRVTETRLLRDVATVGEVHDDLKRAEDNLLIAGDSGDALRALTRLPEFADRYRGKVKLVYIDPPFNTGQAFEHYDDGVEHSVWLTMMRERLLLIRDLLAEDGSVWVHLDDSEMAYCKVLMDEIFGRSNFAATIVWETDAGRRNDTAISTVQDYILVFAKNWNVWRPTRNLLPRTADQEKRYKNPDGDHRGPWLQGADSTAKSGSEAMRYPVTLPSGRVVTPPSGVYWRFSRENFERALEEGRVYFGKDGNRMPIVKRYLSEVQSGVVPRTWWPAAEVGSNMGAKRDHFRKMFPDIPAFATPKPEGLMERVITIASNPGDIVLDCFGGSGTTAAVAHKMGRRWVAIERERATVETFLRPRLEMVVNGEEPGGVTASVGWEKGGGFRHLEVAPSMYERLGNRLLLAPWVAGDAFAAAACAQIPGFELQPGAQAPFVGGKGRQRLAVVDGLVSEGTVRSVVEALSEDERVLIVAKSYLREAATLLENLSPGSRIKKAPQDLLDMKGRVLR
ncbi:site-specific DNA-methyltransferase [Streptomyces sp. 4R-3d]|uniref:site-specific DNA-methyltransferase n=1 Tax=Streptomyces sp. 4R-3d TaxID=2559605 RepID=UPI00107242A9|nr:site-specific DNA-methyltransferase [Streptomyces sp. 4R-3d]TFI28601.1 site-specific DNA-methyltransferase [Streptomyces sp. 4R-3d]